MLVLAYAFLDCLDGLLATQKRLPGVDVLGLVKVAIGDIGQSLESNRGENVVPVRNLPRIDQGREFVLMPPEIKGVFAPFLLCAFQRSRTSVPIQIGRSFQLMSDSCRSEATLWV